MTDFETGIAFIVRNKSALLKLCASVTESYVVNQTIEALAAELEACARYRAALVRIAEHPANVTGAKAMEQIARTALGRNQP